MQCCHMLFGYAPKSASVPILHSQTTLLTVYTMICSYQIDAFIYDCRQFSSLSSVYMAYYNYTVIISRHYSVPKIPKLKGQDTFTGTIMHSHVYRKPEDFKDQSVVCIGAGSSGQDIALDLHPHAKMVYLSHWKPTLQSEFPKNVTQVSPVDHLNGNQVVFTSGEKVEADTILLCTGYKYSFPFLSKECGVKVNIEENQISPLFQHMIHSQFPSLSFIGVTSAIAPFPLFSCQMRLILAVLEGAYKLPCKEQIEKENQVDLQVRLDLGWPLRYTHKLGHLQWEYNNKLTELAGVTPISPVVHNLYDEVHYHRSTNVWHYKNLNFEIVDEKNWQQIIRQGSGDA